MPSRTRLPISASADLEITIDDREAIVFLNAIRGVMSGFSLYYFLRDEGMKYLRKRAVERFDDEGDDASGKWTPLAEATVGIRESEGYPGAHPINKRTGELERYITSGGWPAFRQTPQMASLTWPGREPSGELGRKFRTAQSGRAFPRTPARPVLAINERDTYTMLGMLALWIGVQIDRAQRGFPVPGMGFADVFMPSAVI